MAGQPWTGPVSHYFCHFFGIFNFYHAWVMVKVNMQWKMIKEK
jgi:hypothetical protein